MKTVIHKSKIDGNLTYHSSKVGSFTYVKVMYKDKVLFGLDRGPVHTMKVIKHCESNLGPLIPEIEAVYLGMKQADQSPVYSKILDISSELTAFYKK